MPPCSCAIHMDSSAQLARNVEMAIIDVNRPRYNQHRRNPIPDAIDKWSFYGSSPHYPFIRTRIYDYRKLFTPSFEEICVAWIWIGDRGTTIRHGRAIGPKCRRSYRANYATCDFLGTIGLGNGLPLMHI